MNTSVQKDLHATVRALKQQNQSQIARLSLKSDDDIQLIELVREFAKKRAELEADYWRSIERLTRTYSQRRIRRNSNARPPTTIGGVPEKPADDVALSSMISGNTASNRQLANAWFTMLAELEKQAKLRTQLCERSQKDIVDSIKDFTKDKAAVFKKHAEYGAKLQEELWKSYVDVEKNKKIYDDLEKEAMAAKVKYDEALKPTKFGFQAVKMMVKGTDSAQHIEKAKKRWKNCTHKAQDARNDYLLALEACNAHQTHFYQSDIPEFLRKIDGDYYERFQSSLRTAGDIDAEFAQIIMASVEIIRQQADRINRSEDEETFLKDNKMFKLPNDFSFEPYGTDEVSKIVVDEVSKVVLSKKLEQLKRRQIDIEDDLEKKEKQLQGLSQMAAVYSAQPDFGKASDPLEEKLALEYATVLLGDELVKINRQVATLEGLGITVMIPNARPRKAKNENTNSAESSSRPTSMESSIGRRAIVLYPYEAKSDLELTIKTGEEMRIFDENADGWVEAELRGRRGVVPLSYVQAQNDDDLGLGKNKVIALYNYEATDDTELAFQAGDIIEVLDRGTDDDGWWEGRLPDGRTGQFPNIFVDTSSLEPIKSTAQSASNSASLSRSGTMTKSAANNSNRMSVLVEPPAPANGGSNGAAPDLVRSLYDYDETCEGELSFKAGDIIEVINRDIGSDVWWEGRLVGTGRVGQFPNVYVEPYHA